MELELLQKFILKTAQSAQLVVELFTLIYVSNTSDETVISMIHVSKYALNYRHTAFGVGEPASPVDEQTQQYMADVLYHDVQLSDTKLMIWQQIYFRFYNQESN